MIYIFLSLNIRATLELERSVVASLKDSMMQAPLNEKASCNGIRYPLFVEIMHTVCVQCMCTGM